MNTDPAVLEKLVQAAASGPVPRCSGRRPKVLLLFDEVEAPGQNETREQLLQWVARMKQCGAAPQICVLRGTTWLNATIAGCPVRHYDCVGMASWDGLKQALDLLRWMRSHRFDLLQTMMPDASKYGPLLGRLAGVRTIVILRQAVQVSAQPELPLLLDERHARAAVVKPPASTEVKQQEESGKSDILGHPGARSRIGEQGLAYATLAQVGCTQGEG